MKRKEWHHLSLTISQPKLGQIGHVGFALKMSGQADSKTVPGSVPGFDN